MPCWPPFRSTVASCLALQAKILALRHRLAGLQRQAPHRPRLRPVDRLLWVVLSRVWPGWRSAVQIVTPDTVVRWHRRAFALAWRWKSRPRCPGRPALAADVPTLLQQMQAANLLWGAPRIHGELQKLGLKLSQTTVARYLRRRPRPPSQTWRTFLANHGSQIVAIDFGMSWFAGASSHRQEKRRAQTADSIRAGVVRRAWTKLVVGVDRGGWSSR